MKPKYVDFCNNILLKSIIMLTKKIIKISIFLFCFFISFESYSSLPIVNGTENVGDDNYVGKRKRNTPSQASKRSLSRQSKKAKISIRRNDRNNKKNLRHRTKKQKKQKRFSRVKTFR